ncbi:N5-(cytidine 5'-diphosphoramidyl)-L-glutamine hydrolase [Clostridium neonatale]|uniref:gamma-glutamyl-gamma-aminobutyrate hydrolase family protein n=1 Tax=Clostridium TaxID=1485 RepID=UPI0029114D4C|nr:gamma-glutamyl-gamma-aminobutyrate hydrolase family protein [Clostridium sp.]MDU4478595.1 gamma-glutamyl-gamma-aminobutyrate hydrolase family protein [Clostridium sp.]CAI3672968.1 N5-(cytidine 5'-diphosphoramidyl)-L-glutamine hydrolase [Clostridium neonatale]
MSYLIGMTMRVTHNDKYYEIRDCISYDYIKLLNQYNLQPVLISNNLDNPERYFNNLQCRGLILTGGDDIEFRFDRFKELNINSIDNCRDKTEYRLLQYCLKNDIPVLGICRGLQIINTFFGGDTCKIIGGTHVNVKHKINIVDEYFGELGSKEIYVNSYHNNVIYKNNCAKELNIFAEAKDSIVEGVYIENKLVGIQWHPERDRSMYDENIIKRWIEWI